MNIREDQELGVVLIDGQAVAGWLDDRPCANCGTRRAYAEDYDAFFCPACNVWLEEGCSDPDCGFCANRPARPLRSS